MNQVYGEIDKDEEDSNDSNSDIEETKENNDLNMREYQDEIHKKE